MVHIGSAQEKERYCKQRACHGKSAISAIIKITRMYTNMATEPGPEYILFSF